MNLKTKNALTLVVGTEYQEGTIESKLMEIHEAISNPEIAKELEAVENLKQSVAKLQLELRKSELKLAEQTGDLDELNDECYDLLEFSRGEATYCTIDTTGDIPEVCNVTLTRSKRKRRSPEEIAADKKAKETETKTEPVKK